MKKAIIGIIVVVILAVIFLPRFNSYMIEKRTEEERVLEEKAAYEQKEREEKKTYMEEKADEEAIEEERLRNLNFYEKINERQDARIFIIGDGAVGGLGVEERKANWDYIMQEAILDKYDTVTKVNKLAFQGATAPLGCVSYKTAFSDYEPDLVIMGYGYNDQKLVSAEIYSLFYERLIRGITDKYPETNIVMVRDHRLQEDTDHTRAMEALAKYYSIDVVDMRGMFDENDPKYVADNGYPTYDGNLLYADKMLEYFDYHVTQKTSGITVGNPQLPMNAEIAQLANLDLVPQAMASEGLSVFGDISVAYKEGAYRTYISNKEYILFSYVTSVEGGVVGIFINDELMMEVDTQGPDGNLNTVVIADNMKSEKLIKVEAINIKPEEGRSNIKFIGINTN